MNPVPEIDEGMLAYWSELAPSVVTFNAPDGMSDCTPCQAVVTHPGIEAVVRVPWRPDEIELAHLARGGTIWLSTWGGLPPHMLEVQEPALIKAACRRCDGGKIPLTGDAYQVCPNCDGTGWVPA